MEIVKVSVVVATYKRDADLAAALQSLAEQTYPNVEIVLVDDNGNAEWNERVAEIVRVFQTAHPAVEMQYIVNNPNQGSAKTRNIGIAAARGKYVTFLDDDDVYLPDKIAHQVQFMEDGALDYSITDLALFNEQDKLVDRRVRGYIKDTAPASLRQYHLTRHLTGTDTMMFTKAYLEKIGGFAPIDVGDEFYLMQRAIDGEGKFGYLPACDVKARVHSTTEGISSGDGKIRGENALYAYKKGFFKQINAKTRRYIRMRHYAVLAFAEIRRKRYLAFVGHAMRAFFSAPFAFAKMVLFER